jgi:hypothetical protein
VGDTSRDPHPFVRALPIRHAVVVSTSEPRIGVDCR